MFAPYGSNEITDPIGTNPRHAKNHADNASNLFMGQLLFWKDDDACSTGQACLLHMVQTRLPIRSERIPDTRRTTPTTLQTSSWDNSFSGKMMTLARQGKHVCSIWFKRDYRSDRNESQTREEPRRQRFKPLHGTTPFLER